jgi:hypothetical protein
MPERKKSPDLPTELAKLLPPEFAKRISPEIANALAKKITPEIAKQLAALTVTRSGDYKTIYSDVFRTRIGSGDVTLIFSKLTSSPNIAAIADIVEEKAEIVMSWPQLKMFEQVLRAIVDAVEQEIGKIPIPAAFKVDPEANRTVIQNLGLSSGDKKRN